MPLHAMPDPEPANPEPSAWAQAHWMATKGTTWIVRRSRDLVPRLLQLAAKEWWHDRRARDTGRDLIALGPRGARMSLSVPPKATYAGMDAGSSSTGRGSDYAELPRQIRRDGLLNRRPRYYAIRITILAVLYAAGWAAVVALGDSWYQLLVAIYLAVIFGQIGFLGHEAGHRQIFRSRRANDVVGLVAATC